MLDPGIPLEKVFHDLCLRYSGDQVLISRLWASIEDAYHSPERYYHTFDHLSSMYRYLTECERMFSNPDSALFALFYHDFVYDYRRPDNEEESAREAARVLGVMGVQVGIAERVRQFILVTKNHAASGDPEVDTFTDIDISILGADQRSYDLYSQNIRHEYSAIPYDEYKAGRTRVLQHFLAMDTIFKTELLRSRFEAQARKNIAREVVLIS